MKNIISIILFNILFLNLNSMVQEYICDSNNKSYEVACELKDGKYFVKDDKFDAALKECRNIYNGSLVESLESNCFSSEKINDFQKYIGESCNDRMQTFHCVQPNKNMISMKVKCKEKDNQCIIDVADYNAKKRSCKTLYNSDEFVSSPNLRCKLDVS